MLAFPHCKINLGLHITRKREDGFHDLESVFYPVPWTDALEVICKEDKGIRLNMSGISIPGDKEGNLAFKAYELLSADFNMPGVDMYLHKVIPMGAGLGGGSSDGAFALRLLNQVCRLGLDNTSLRDYASKLGSDCPFFIGDSAQLATGRGELLQPAAIDLRGWHITIVMPPVRVSTAEAYSWIRPHKSSADIPGILSEPPETWNNRLLNDFEPVVSERYPVIGQIKNRLIQLGASYASMSGSGAAIFGLFREKPEKVEWPDCICWSGLL